MTPNKRVGPNTRTSRSALQRGVERRHLRKKPTVASVALLNAGFSDGMTGLVMVASWLIAREELGRWPVNVEEYADHWKMSGASAYRELRMFKRCFPGFDSVTDFCVTNRLRIPGVARHDADPTMVVDWLMGEPAKPTLLGGAT
jgi:hypothetical protein